MKKAADKKPSAAKDQDKTPDHRPRFRVPSIGAKATEKLYGNQADVAAHLCTTAPMILEYLSKGIIERQPDGSFELSDCRERLLEHLRARAVRRVAASMTGGMDLTAERAKLASEQSQMVAFKSAVLRGEFVKVEIALASVRDFIAVVREKLLTLPGKLTDRLTMQEQHVVEEALTDEIHEILDELTAPETFKSAEPDDAGLGGEEEILGEARRGRPRVQTAAKA